MLLTNSISLLLLYFGYNLFMAIIKISKKNLFYNLNQLTLKSGSKSKISAVLKDNAYGHGIELMAKLLSEYGIKEAVVVNNHEAETIKNYFENILILNDTPKNIRNFSYAITSIDALKKVEKNIKIELKVDTGMHRNGILMCQLQEAIDNFEWVKKQILNANLKPRFHSHNSASLLRSNSFNEDIARVGIAMYGFNELPDCFNKMELKPIMSLWAKRTTTRKLKKGQRVGYGGDFIAPKDIIISTYDAGFRINKR